MYSEDFSKQIVTPGQELLGGAHLVEASAGTGNTYSIQNIYARLVMEKDFKVSKTLVVTFTEAATKELRDRLHAVLKDLQARFLDNPCTPNNDIKDEDKRKKDVEKRNKRADDLIKCVPYGKENKTAQANVEIALLEFDNAAISTIHGFCQRVLSRYAFETGFQFNQEVENNESDLDKLAEDWWRTNASKLSESEKKKYKLSTLKKFIRKLYGKADYEIVDEESENSKLLSEADIIVKQYEKERSNREKLNFDDLLRGLRDALRHDIYKRLTTALREEFQAAIIDEYQDTDPVQNEIFRRIFLDGDVSKTPVYFVGDPKQAIYAFRGGDVYSYLNTAKEFKDNDAHREKHGLAVNHRSTKRLIDAINDIFRRDNTFGIDEIKYNDVKFDEKEEHDEFKGALLDKPFRIVEFEPKNEKFSMTSEKDTVLDIIAAQIHEILNEPSPKGDNKSAFSNKDIAILLNSKTHMEAMQKKLFEAGVPSVIQKSGNVFSSPIAVELLAFLEAIVETGNDDCLNAGLATVFGRSEDGTIPSIDTQDDKAEQIERFRKLEKLWRRNGFAALMAGLGKGDYQVRQASKSRRLLSDIAQIIELCVAAQGNIGRIPENLLSWLTDRINNSGKSQYNADDNKDDESDVEEYQRELETDDDAVTIMTIHNSKGLQFPVVILPDCWNVNGTRDPRNKFSFGKKEDKDYLFHFHEENNLKFSKAIGRQKIAEKELKDEKVRLLYVAMTRAKERTRLITPSLNAFKENKDKEPLIDLLSSLDRNNNNKLPYEWKKPEQKDLQQMEKDPETDHLIDGWTPEKHANVGKTFSTCPLKGSYSSMSPSHEEDMDKFDDENRNEADEEDGEPDEVTPPPSDSETHPVFLLPGGTAIGTCWHNILEKLPFDADEETIKKFSEQELLNSGFNPEQTYGKNIQTILDITVSMIQKTLNYTIVSPKGEHFSLKAIGWKDRLSEQEFEFSTHDNEKTIVNLAKTIYTQWEKEQKGEQDKTLFIKVLKEISEESDKDKKSTKRIPSGYVKGFMDLVFRHNDMYYIIDWKSNPIDREKDDFTAEGIRKEMAKHWYFLQYLIYAATLHNFLKKTLDGYSWEKHFGGIRYYFLRGIAAECEQPVFEDRPSEELLKEIAKVLGMENNDGR